MVRLPEYRPDQSRYAESTWRKADDRVNEPENSTYARDQGDWEPTRWYTVHRPNGQLWAETSDRAGAVTALRPGDRSHAPGSGSGASRRCVKNSTERTHHLDSGGSIPSGVNPSLPQPNPGDP